MNQRIAEYYRIATWSAIGLAVIYAMVLRAHIAWDLPLWLDESWTAVLSSAPDLRTFARYMWLDSNAPLYYVLIWLWPFESNFGLRVPSFIFMLATAAVAILWRPNGVRRGTAIFWAALLLLLWKPGTGLFIDARYYALLLLISTAQTIAFMKLLEEPSRKRACWWTGLATLGVLTHYYAALPALVQGLFYLGRHRAAALRTWPALLLLAPAVAWAAFHWPRLVKFAEPGVTWYSSVRLSEVPDLLFWPIAANWMTGIGIVALVILFRTKERLPSSVVMTKLAALATTAAFALIGYLWPLVTERYLIPLIPPMLLGVAVLVRPAGYLPLITLFFLSMGGASASVREMKLRSARGVEWAARYLPEATNVTWIMGRPGQAIHDRPQMEAILVDAFKRSGRTVKPRCCDKPMAGDGLIWLFFEDDKPLSDKVRATWDCRTFVTGYTSILVCSKPG